MISFSEPIYRANTVPFPDGAPGAYVVAPYWDDVDIRIAGTISYEVHSRRGNNPGSNQLLDEVSSFVEDSIGQSFQGSWMLVAEWKEVHPWPHGSPSLSPFYPETLLVSEALRQLQHIKLPCILALCLQLINVLHIAYDIVHHWHFLINDVCINFVLMFNTDEYLSRVGDNRQNQFLHCLHLSLWRYNLGF